MRSPAAAIAWEFRQRHRWGLLALIAYLFVLAIIKLVILERGQRADLDDLRFAFVVLVPLTATFLYILAVFSFGLSGDLAARQSMYPARMFTLPVTTAALAGWPMLYGSVAMAILWFGTRLFALWPSDIHVPVFWPALLGASLLAWTQALTWMPYPLPGLRVIITVLWLASIDAVIMVALKQKASEPVMLAILAPHVPLAYLVARFAVASARRGDVPDWRRMFTRVGKTAARDPFRSAARAQAWFEWRLYGPSLPWWVAILLPFELVLLYPFRQTPELIFEVLLFVLFTPPFMAAFVAAKVSDSDGVNSFLATRPLTDASLIAAKLKAMMWSTLVVWLLVLVAVPVALRSSGAAPVVIERAHRLVEVVGMPRAIAIAMLLLIALMASTWKQLVQSLYIGMSGREWVVKASVFVTLTFLALILPLAVWISRSRYAMAVLWTNFSLIAAVLVCLKLSAAVWIAMRLHDKRLLSDRTLVIGAVSWDVAVFSLYGLLVWIVPLVLIGSYVLALVAILEVPLARLAAAPLALAWNRHR
ncbi:MAG TPA: hypothetical protein VKL19_15075 [Thermoanaerobaculia bacterium]|nr:hypothetical protein [Thermoanaerobaculia bacterium]